jgi:hypothetical protein
LSAPRRIKSVNPESPAAVFADNRFIARQNIFVVRVEQMNLTKLDWQSSLWQMNSKKALDGRAFS